MVNKTNVVLARTYQMAMGATDRGNEEYYESGGRATGNSISSGGGTRGIITRHIHGGMKNEN